MAARRHDSRAIHDSASVVLEGLLAEVTDVVAGQLGLRRRGRSRGSRARLVGPGDGTGPVEGALCFVDGSDVVVQVELAVLAADATLAAPTLFADLGAFSHYVRVLPVRDVGDGNVGVGVELRVGARRPWDAIRRSQLSGELERVRSLAEDLRRDATTPPSPGGEALTELYADVGDYLAPLGAWMGPDPSGELVAWAEGVVESLTAGLSVSIPGESVVESDVATHLVADRLVTAGRSLGVVRLPRLDAGGILKMVDMAPGVVAVAAGRLSSSGHHYHRHEELRGALARLGHEGRSVLLTGTWSEQQAALHGGQGAPVDPTRPLISPIPPVELSQAVEFLSWTASRSEAGADPEEVAGIVLDALEDLPRGTALRLAPVAVRRAASTPAGCVRDFVTRLVDAGDTYGGLSRSTRRPSRSEDVAATLIDVLASEALERGLREVLLGQDRAVGQLVARLRTEALTRSDHQPLRALFQGPPGVGKSQAVKVVSDLLGMPLVRIDAGAWPDHYTAAATLRGAGRGIVMSDRPGALEQAAKHHGGAVVEIADLDHADPRARSAIADLFLEVLDEGEVRTGTGSVVSTTNLLILVTLNLGGEETRVHRTTHFGGRVSKAEADRKVFAELEAITSSAWMSRMGRPVVFEPLADVALASIATGVVRDATSVAVRRRFGLELPVELPSDVGDHVVRAMPGSGDAMGARGLAEFGRSLAAAAVSDLPLERSSTCHSVRVTVGHGGGRLIAQFT